MDTEKDRTKDSKDQSKYSLKECILTLCLILITIFVIVGYMSQEAQSPVITTLYIEDAPENVVFFSDPHLKSYSVDYINKCVELINSLSPSVILIGGDFMSSYYDDTSLQSVWKNFNAPVYAILGNHDYKSGCASSGEGLRKILITHDVTNLSVDGYNVSKLNTDANLTFADSVTAALRGYGVNVLRNDLAELEINGKTLRIIGLDDGWAGQTNPHAINITKNTKNTTNTKIGDETESPFTIYLMHEPDLTADWDADIILSGHTHGGQFGFPIINFINKAGLYKVSGLFNTNNDHTPLYISRGLGSAGVAGLDLRLFVPPEIVIINPKNAILNSPVYYVNG